MDQPFPVCFHGPRPSDPCCPGQSGIQCLPSKTAGNSCFNCTSLAPARHGHCAAADVTSESLHRIPVSVHVYSYACSCTDACAFTHTHLRMHATHHVWHLDGVCAHTRVSADYKHSRTMRIFTFSSSVSHECRRTERTRRPWHSPSRRPLSCPHHATLTRKHL